MQIKIEIDVKPEELRRFLGLPDVAGLQDDVVQFLRDKVGQVNENFNPADFVRSNLDAVRSSPAWKRVMTRIVGEDEPEPPPEPPRKKRSARKGPPKS
ncbi:MAG TPA: DUF6489 family protein [Nevskiaceae bacterium]|nr:DUF6489 family protein [Nevskiaceae bacterium]